MIRVEIRPVWRFAIDGRERDFDFQLIALLEALHREPKLTTASVRAGISYRHAWNLIEQWETFFGAALVSMARGRGTRLTPFGSRLLWAGQRAGARLAPELESLASEFAASINASAPAAVPALTMHASHDFAVGALQELLGKRDVMLDVRYRGSFDALAALARGECDVAGFHIPDGELGHLMARRYAESLSGVPCQLVALATRIQGFIVRAGNPRRIRTVRDLARRGVRMVNRQRGSGTRALFEFLLSANRIDRARLSGYDHEEATHGAVAALVAGGQADAGFGVEAAAAKYALGFVPQCSERYFLACRTGTLRSPAFEALRAVLASAEFAQVIAALPGYGAGDSGRLHEAADILAARPAIERA